MSKYAKGDLVLVLPNLLGIPTGELGVVNEVYYYKDGSIRYWCSNFGSLPPWDDADWSCELLESSLAPAGDMAKAIFLD